MSPPPPPPPPPPPGIPEENFKTCLQQYTQGACIPLPIYETFNEGLQHSPKFRTRVWVDETCFISPNLFSNRKASEQDAAKYALIGVVEKVKTEGPARILENTVFCKTIINEYASKMNLNLPTYVTKQPKASLPVLVSSLVLDGVTFVGAPGKNKKEAEQLAARSAILSILETESCTTMSKLVRSKFRFYDELNDWASVHTTPPNNEPNSSTQIDNVRNQEQEVNSLEDKRKAPNEPTVENHNGSSSVPLEEGIVVNKRQRVDCGTIFDGQTLPLNETREVHVTTSFEVMHPEASMESSGALAFPPEITPSIVFVPPLSEQALSCSTSGKKPRRRKKRGKNKVQHQSPLNTVMIPQTPVQVSTVAN